MSANWQMRLGDTQPQSSLAGCILAYQPVSGIREYPAPHAGSHVARATIPLRKRERNATVSQESTWHLYLPARELQLSAACLQRLSMPPKTQVPRHWTLERVPLRQGVRNTASRQGSQWQYRQPAGFTLRNIASRQGSQYRIASRQGSQYRYPSGFAPSHIASHSRDIDIVCGCLPLSHSRRTLGEWKTNTAHCTLHPASLPTGLVSAANPPLP